MDLREIDRLVAEKVMGWTEVAYQVGGYGDGRNNTEEGPWYEWKGRRTNKSWDLLETVPAFSRDVALAWAVVEKLRGDWDFHLSGESSVVANPRWYCSLTPIHNGAGEYGPYADTAALAICLAALKARGVEV